jgi:fructosamine-3-kinase
MPGRPQPFVKRTSGAPEGFFRTEAAGLLWLAEATGDGGAQVVEVLDVGRFDLTLHRLTPAPATSRAAEDLGRALAITHRAGAPCFGAAAPGAGGLGWIGPLPMPVLEAPTRARAGAPHRRWGPFFAAERLRPFLRLAQDSGAVDAVGSAVIERVCRRLADGDPGLTGPPEPAARLHGDLWAGNVFWTPSGAVLIDPAAHGGHRESDLAMLALFGMPYLDRILAAYHEADPLADGWQRRAGVHQLFPLLVHAALFGSGYGHQAAAVARRHA